MPEATAPAQIAESPANTAPAETGVAPANDNAAAGAPKKFDVSFDEQVKADLAFKKHEKAALTEIETRRKALEAEAKKYEPLAPVMSRIEKGEVEDAIWAIPGVKWTPELVMKLVDRVAAMQPETEVPVDDKIKAAIEADRKAREDVAAAEELAKTEADKAAWAQDFGDYMTAVVGTKDKPGFLKAHKDEFPLCNAWAHRLPLDRIDAELQRRLQAGESVEAGEVFKVFEAEFQVEIDRTPFGRKAPAAPEPEGFEAQERAYFAAKPGRKPAPPAPPSEPTTPFVREFVQPQGKDFDTAVSEHFRRLDQERMSKVRF